MLVTSQYQHILIITEVLNVIKPSILNVFIQEKIDIILLFNDS